MSSVQSTPNSSEERTTPRFQTIDEEVFANSSAHQTVFPPTAHDAQSRIHAALVQQEPEKQPSLFFPFCVLLLSASLMFTGLYKFVVPEMVEKFARNNLKPAELQLVNFQGVFANPNAAGLQQIGASPEISRALTSGELIFDFTSESRTFEKHGYTKSAQEWYIKTPTLGEEAILLTPAIALGLGLGAFSFAFMFLLSAVLPSNIGLLAALAERAIRQTRFTLAMQTGLSEEDLDVMRLSDAELLLLAKSESNRIESSFERLWNVVAGGKMSESDVRKFHPKMLQPSSYALFRAYCLQRMAEVLSPAIALRMQHLREVAAWSRQRVRLYAAWRFFMQEYFVPRFANVVSGMAYCGAAFLIVSVGLRGLRFIPASRPSVLLATISLECAFLLLLGITLAFQHEETSGIESLKRIEHGMNDVARLVQGVNPSVIERAFESAAKEHAASPEMQERISKNITNRVVAALQG